MRLVHVNAADLDLAEDWLRQASGPPPVIVSDVDDAPLAAGLAMRHGLRHHVLPDTPDRPEALRLRPLLGRVADEAVILSEPARMSMVFLSGEEQPAWNDRYPAVRVLHALAQRVRRLLAGFDGDDGLAFAKSTRSLKRESSGFVWRDAAGRDEALLFSFWLRERFSVCVTSLS